jgi:phosphotransferase system HPr-like phosphotransfer protein
MIDEEPVGSVLSGDSGARESIIGEDEFQQLLTERLLDFSHHVALRKAEPGKWSKRFCNLLTEKAHELEAFLDDFEARHNRRFSFLVELVASVRGFGTMAHTLRHLKMRFPKYRIRFTADETESFQHHLQLISDFVGESLRHLLAAMAQEFDALGIDHERDSLPQPVPDEPIRRHLPHDVGEEFDSDQGRIAAILSRFLTIVDQAKRVDQIRPRDELKALEEFVDRHYDETKARAFEGQVHNLQSAYDTHIKSTSVEAEHQCLRELRGHVSLALHLLEISTLLVHFYERHENDIQHRPTSQKISELVDREKVLWHATHFCLVRAADLLVRARPIAAELVPQLVVQEEIEVTIPDGGMLHARPLSLIVRIVQQYGTAVEMIIGDERETATSIMGLIMFVGKHPDVRTVKFSGDARPLADLKQLFEAGLGEGGLDTLPVQLDYLLR